MGFWWNFDTKNGITSHVQLEGNKKINRLVFKVKTSTSTTKKTHSNWSKKLTKLGEELDLSITKPKRLGSGRSVTVAVLENDFRVFSDGVLDMGASVALLKKAQSVLDKARECLETVERIPEALA